MENVRDLRADLKAEQDAINKDAEAHPERLNDDAARWIVEAIVNAYPC
jgi:hypothetical protein